MKINNRTTVSRGHMAASSSSHGFRLLTPGGALSGIDEEDASPAGTSGAGAGTSGASGASSGAIGAPLQEPSNTSGTLCWDGRTLRSSSCTSSSSSTWSSAYLYHNYKRRLQHFNSSSSSSCVRRCLAHSPHSHASTHSHTDPQHQNHRSSRVHYYHQEEHRRNPQEHELGEGHYLKDIASTQCREHTRTAAVPRPLPCTAWEGWEAESGSIATGTVNNNTYLPVDPSPVGNSPVKSESINGSDAFVYKVTTASPDSHTVVSSAAQEAIAGGCTPVSSSTPVQTNGHGIKDQPGRWAALGEVPSDIKVPQTVQQQEEDLSIEDLCADPDGSDDVFAPNEPVLVTSPAPGSGVHPLGEVLDCCNQEAGRPGDNKGTCVCAALYGRGLISPERPPAAQGCCPHRGASSGEPPDMFSRYRSSSIPDHTFIRQQDLGLLQSALSSQISDTGAGGVRGTVQMPGGALTTIVGAAAAPAPSSEADREHGQLAPACMDARPSTCPLDGSAGGVRPFPAANGNAALRLGPHQGSAPEVGLTPPEDCDVPLPVQRSAFSPHGGHYTPRRRELVRLSPLPVSPRATEPLETIGGAAGRVSRCSAMAESGFRPISPTQRNNSALIDSLPLPGSRYSRTPSPTLSVRSLSPGPHTRQRANTFSGSGLMRGDLNSFLSPPRSPARRGLPRDAHQPSKGSISDLSDKHGDAEEAGEEADSFHFRPFQRQRSSTCPENRAWRRRKAAAANRPPTPPPLGGPGSRNSSPRGSLGDMSRPLLAGALNVSLTPTHLPRRSDLSDLREDQDQGDDLADITVTTITTEFPTQEEGTQKQQLQNGGVVNTYSTNADSSQSVALMERLCLQSKATTETNNNLGGAGLVPPGPLPAPRQ